MFIRVFLIRVPFVRLPSGLCLHWYISPFFAFDPHRPLIVPQWHMIRMLFPGVLRILCLSNSMDWGVSSRLVSLLL